MERLIRVDGEMNGLDGCIRDGWIKRRMEGGWRDGWWVNGEIERWIDVWREWWCIERWMVDGEINGEMDGR